MKAQAIQVARVYRRGTAERLVISVVRYPHPSLRGDKLVVYEERGGKMWRCPLQSFARWAQTDVTPVPPPPKDPTPEQLATIPDLWPAELEPAFAAARAYQDRIRRREMICNGSAIERLTVVCGGDA